MFTGIITDIGKIDVATPLNEGVRLRIQTDYDPDTIDIGASIACDGICLTVVEKSDAGNNARWFDVEAWEEACRLTTIATWQPERKINLERSLKIGDELGGHLVSGHVDGTATVIETIDEGDARRFRIDAPNELVKFIAQKGSVALNGTSLTVNAVKGTIFDVLLIRHSMDVTTWGNVGEADVLNIEIDTMARYAARLVEVEQRPFHQEIW